MSALVGCQWPTGEIRFRRWTTFRSTWRYFEGAPKSLPCSKISAVAKEIRSMTDARSVLDHLPPKSMTPDGIPRRTRRRRFSRGTRPPILPSVSHISQSQSVASSIVSRDGQVTVRYRILTLAAGFVCLRASNILVDGGQQHSGRMIVPQGIMVTRFAVRPASRARGESSTTEIVRTHQAMNRFEWMAICRRAAINSPTY